MREYVQWSSIFFGLFGAQTSWYNTCLQYTNILMHASGIQKFSVCSQKKAWFCRSLKLLKYVADFKNFETHKVNASKVMYSPAMI